MFFHVCCIIHAERSDKFSDHHGAYSDWPGHHSRLCCMCIEQKAAEQQQAHPEQLLLGRYEVEYSVNISANNEHAAKREGDEL